MLLGPGTASMAGATFFDGTINFSNYTQTIFNSNPAGITITPTQCASCGNTGSAIDVNYAFNPTSPASFSTCVGMRNNSWVWSPATQGAITSLDYSVDKFIHSNVTMPTASSSVEAMLFQNGKYYIAFLFPNIAWDVWTPVGLGFGLQPNNFELFDFTTGIRDAASELFVRSGSDYIWLFRAVEQSGGRDLGGDPGRQCQLHG